MNDQNEIGTSIVELLRDPLFNAARRVMIRVEVDSMARSIIGILELRDALDTLVFAANAKDADEARAFVQTAHEHVRRAAVEPLEDLAGMLIYRMEKRLSMYWFRRSIQNDMPDRREIFEALDNAKQHLQAAELVKGDIRTAPEAIDHFAAILDNLAPLARATDVTILEGSWRILRYLIPIVGSAGLGAILTVLLTSG